jgi:hypothetical protein
MRLKNQTSCSERISQSDVLASDSPDSVIHLTSSLLSLLATINISGRPLLIPSFYCCEYYVLITTLGLNSICSSQNLHYYTSAIPIYPEIDIIHFNNGLRVPSKSVPRPRRHLSYAPDPARVSQSRKPGIATVRNPKRECLFHDMDYQ